MKDSKLRNFNGVNYSLEGHTHPVLPVDSTAFRAINSTVQTLAANTNTKVLFPTVTNDLGGRGTTLHRYIVGSDGMYLVEGSLKWTTAVAGTLMIYKNGVNLTSLVDTTIALNQYEASTLIYLLKNDYIELWTNTTSSRSTDGTSTRFCVSKVPN